MALDVGPLISPASTALLVNEVQPSTVSGPGDLNEAGARILPTIVTLVDAARAADVQVMHCVKVFRRDSLARNRNILLYRRRGLVSDEPAKPDSRPVPGSVVAPELGPDERDLVMTRLHGMGAVTDTGVVPVLRNLGSHQRRRRRRVAQRRRDQHRDGPREPRLRSGRAARRGRRHPGFLRRAGRRAHDQAPRHRHDQRRDHRRVATE